MSARKSRRAWWPLVVCALAGCAAGPPPSVAPPPPEPVSEDEIAAVAILLELEDRRDLVVPIFRDLAASESPRVRARTATALARIGDPAGRAIVRGLITDRDTTVAATAAFAAGQLRDTASVGVLMGLLPAGAVSLSAPTVAAEAARALAGLGTPQSRTALITFLARADVRSDATARVAETALLAASLLDDVGIDPAARWLEANDPGVRRAAALALGHGDRPGTAGYLAPLLDDREDAVRAAALTGLSARALATASVDTGEILTKLIELAGDSAYSVRTESIRALGRFPVPRAAAALLALLESGGPHDRLTAIEALAELGTAATGASPILAELARDGAENAFLRAAAVRIAVHLDPRSAPGLLADLDADPAWRVRATIAASRALGGIPDAPGLRRAARDIDPRVASASIEAAIAVVEESGTDFGIRSLLLDAVQSQDAHVRAMALHGLGRFGDATIFPVLLDAYQAAADDPENVARLAAIDAIASLRGRALAAPERAFFARFPRSEDYVVRRRAIERLGAIATERWGDVRPIETGVVAPVYEDHIRRFWASLDPVASRPRAVIRTEAGTVDVVLFADLAPLTVANFLRLAAIGYFDGQEISHLLPHGLVHAGDPRGDTTSGPGYTLRSEANRLPFAVGSLGMAQDGPDTAGGRFFIALAPDPRLDGTHTHFGEVTSGMDVLQRVLPGDRIISIRLVQEGEGC